MLQAQMTNLHNYFAHAQVITYVICVPITDV